MKKKKVTFKDIALFNAWLCVSQEVENAINSADDGDEQAYMDKSLMMVDKVVFNEIKRLVRARNK
jgi:hypothetical protein